MYNLNSFKTLIVAFALAVMLVLGSNTNVQAQCPTDIAPTGAPAWIHATVPLNFNISCPSGTCNVDVDYCYRYISNYPTSGTTTYQTVVVGDINYSGNCDCSDQSRFDQIAVHLQKTATGLGGCTGNYTPLIAATYKSACWKKVPIYDINHVLISRQYTPCSNARCKISCEICESNGVVTFQNCSTAILGTVDCEKLLVWGDGQCSLVDCSSNPN